MTLLNLRHSEQCWLTLKSSGMWCNIVGFSRHFQVVQNSGDYSPSDMALHPRRLESSTITMLMMMMMVMVMVVVLTLFLLHQLLLWVHKLKIAQIYIYKISCFTVLGPCEIWWLRDCCDKICICGRVQLKCDGTRWCTGGEVKGKLANVVGSQYSSHYLRTWCIQHYSTSDAHNFGCQ